MSETVPVQQPLVRQAYLPGFCPVEEALKQLSEAGIEERGAIFTRREVVDFILDLVGYTPDRPLHKLSLLEPSFGNGDFLLAAVERLLAAWRNLAEAVPVAVLADSIRAVELHETSFKSTRAKLAQLLQDAGISRDRCFSHCIDTWLTP